MIQMKSELANAKRSGDQSPRIAIWWLKASRSGHDHIRYVMVDVDMRTIQAVFVDFVGYAIAEAGIIVLRLREARQADKLNSVVARAFDAQIIARRGQIEHVLHVESDGVCAISTDVDRFNAGQDIVRNRCQIERMNTIAEGEDTVGDVEPTQHI